MKLSKPHVFLPSTQRATEWANLALDLLSTPHPLWLPQNLYNAFLEKTVPEVISEVESSEHPELRLIRLLTSLFERMGRDIEGCSPIEQMLTFRHCCLEMNELKHVRVLDRWLYTTRQHSLRSIEWLEQDSRFQDVVSHLQQVYMLDNDGALWRHEAWGFQKVSFVDGIVFTQIQVLNGRFYALDQSGTLWEVEPTSVHICGQWATAQNFLLTPKSPIIRFSDCIRFKQIVIPTPQSHLICSDGEIVLEMGRKIRGYHLSDGSEFAVFHPAEGIDQSMMQAAILDMASTQAGLDFLLHIRFWEHQETRTYRILQQLGDVLYTSSDGKYVISLDDNTVLCWFINNHELILMGEAVMPNAWSVNMAYPIHPECRAVILHTTAGLHAIDFEHNIQCGVKLQPAFSVRVFSIEQPYRFALSTGVGIHFCRFDRYS